MSEKKPVGFLSYAHKDDVHDNGYIRELANYIANEMAVQSGVEYEIFVDNKDIRWGDTWESVLTSSVISSSMLFPIITPSYFKSECCKKEFSEFLGNLKSINNKVFPVYYINCNNLSSPNQKVFDEIMEHQYLDWRKMRFEPLSSPVVRKRIATSVSDIIEPLTVICDDFTEEVSEFMSPSMLSESINKAEYKEKIEPFTIIVDQDSGKYKDISSAIKDAPAGSRILLKSGVYYEPIIIDKAIEIIGLGEQEKDTKIQISIGTTCTIRSNIGRLSNLTIYQAGSDNEPAIEIEQGRFDIQQCSITSQSGNGIVVKSASPDIKGCKINNCGAGGIIFKEQSNGSVEDCDIYENMLANIFIVDESNPSIRRNRIFNGHQSGIYVYGNGYGHIEENDIFNNAHAGVASSNGGDPTVRNNTISSSRHYGGIFVFKQGKGSFENNRLRRNYKGDFQITEKCKPNVILKDNIVS